MTFRTHLLLLPVLLLCMSMTSCQVVADNSQQDPPKGGKESEKIDGVAFVSPPQVVGEREMEFIKTSNADWVQLIPYAYSRPNKTKVSYGSEWQWWGERPDGIRTMIQAAKKQGLKVLVKPHMWIGGHGWAGNYTHKDGKDWEAWAKSYLAYILEFAAISEEEGVDMLCVGTEMKQITIDYPEYFGWLADSVRSVFSGPVTYASNWDNYENLKFWDKMDYIGVDGYFPLVDDATPEVDQLVKAWEGEKKKLAAASKKHQKPILFTEWGYLSVDQSGWRTWELEASIQSRDLNMQAQANCYEAFFQALWDEPWFAGGFAWQWYAEHPNSGGLRDKDHTPQNKPAMEILKERYK